LLIAKLGRTVTNKDNRNVQQNTNQLRTFIFLASFLKHCIKYRGGFVVSMWLSLEFVSSDVSTLNINFACRKL